MRRPSWCNRSGAIRAGCGILALAIAWLHAAANATSVPHGYQCQRVTGEMVLAAMRTNVPAVRR